MEVHAHTHTPRKKWTHYFWEFLMLFFAVTLGFFVENQREHYIEHQREKKFTAQLLSDLKKDTSTYGYTSSGMKRAVEFYDSARIYFQQNTSITDDNFTRLARELYVTFNLITTTTTFNQMKASGSLRYIRNTNLAADLSSYYDQWVPALLTFFEYINEKLHTQIEPFFTQHFDLNVTPVYDSYDSLPANLRYYNRSETSDLLIKNYFQLYFNGAAYIERIALKSTRDKAVKLIELLKKEYRLK